MSNKKIDKDVTKKEKVANSAKEGSNTCLGEKKGGFQMKIGGELLDTFPLNIIGLKDLRQNITDIYSEAINNFKYFVTGNVRRDNPKTLSILSTDVLNSILEKYQFNPIVNFDEETNQYEVVFNEIDVTGCGDTKEDAITMVVENILGLKDDFFDNIELYMRIDNMKKKYPYYLRINNCTNMDELLKVLNLS